MIPRMNWDPSGFQLILGIMLKIIIKLVGSPRVVSMHSRLKVDPV